MKRSIGSVLVAASLLVGCASKPPAAAPATPCPVQTITVSVLASPAVNPSAQGEPRPVVVRVYQLKSDAHLYNAAFDDVWHDDKTALGADLVKVDELQLYPGTRADQKFARAEGVDHIAVVALFQSPKGKTWFSTSDIIPPPSPGKCDVCESEVCEGMPAAALLNPQLAFWLDGSKVDDGADHLDDFPAVGPMRGASAGAKGASAR